MGHMQRQAIQHPRQRVAKHLSSLGVFVLLVCTVSLLFPLVQEEMPRSDQAHKQSIGHDAVGGTPELPVLIPSMHGTLVDLQAQRVIAFDTLVEAVAEADVVAVGETHDHPDIQGFVLCLLQALTQRRPQRLALAMEFLARHEQPAVDAYLAGTIDHHTFATHVRATAPFMLLYFPLLHYARQQGLPVVAMNAPPYIAQQVAHKGLQQTLQQLRPDERAYLPEPLSAVTPAYRAYFLAAVAAAHPVQREQMEHFIEASFLKDETMADSLATFLDQHHGFTVLALAGQFHFAYGKAIPVLLRQRRPHVVMPRLLTLVVPDDDLVRLQPLARDKIADYLQFFSPFPARTPPSVPGPSSCPERMT